MSQQTLRILNEHASDSRSILDAEICRAPIEMGQEEKVQFSHRSKEGLKYSHKIQVGLCFNPSKIDGEISIHGRAQVQFYQ